MSEITLFVSLNRYFWYLVATCLANYNIYKDSQHGVPWQRQAAEGRRRAREGRNALRVDPKRGHRVALVCDVLSVVHEGEGLLQEAQG